MSDQMAMIHGLAFLAFGLGLSLLVVLGVLVVSCRRALADAESLLGRDAEELELLGRDLDRSYQDAEATEDALVRSHQETHDQRIRAEAAEADARFFETVLARKNGEAEALKGELAKARRAATLASADADGAAKDADAILDLVAAIHDSTGDMLDTYSTTCCCGAGRQGGGGPIEHDPDDDDRDDGTVAFTPSRN